MNTQISLPVVVNPDELKRKHTLGSAIELCADVAGFELDKTLQMTLGVDKAQFSRWLSGQEGIMWSKLTKLMDTCGNDAPILWMLQQRGYDLSSVRKVESEIQKENRELRDQVQALLKVVRAA